MTYFNPLLPRPPLTPLNKIAPHSALDLIEAQATRMKAETVKKTKQLAKQTKIGSEEKNNLKKHNCEGFVASKISKNWKPTLSTSVEEATSQNKEVKIENVAEEEPSKDNKSFDETKFLDLLGSLNDLEN